MNTVSNDCLNVGKWPKTKPRHPKGINTVNTVFQTRFFGGEGGAKATPPRAYGHTPLATLSAVRSPAASPVPDKVLAMPAKPRLFDFGGSDRHHGQDGVLLPITLDGPMLRFIPKPFEKK